MITAVLASAASDKAPGLETDSLADLLVTLADLAHIAGAARGDAVLLRQAVAAYDAHLERVPENLDAMRMRAETLLRCRDNSAAFAAFRQLHRLSSSKSTAQRPEAEVAPFQLEHDAECVEDAVRHGAEAAYLTRAAAWRELATQLRRGHGGSDGSTDCDVLLDQDSGTRYTQVRSLSPSQVALLGTHGGPLPLPPPNSSVDGAAVAEWLAVGVLRADIDWVAMVRAYHTQPAAVIDDLLSPPALAAMQAFARHGAHFRTLRRGYLGCFPGDGAAHPLVEALADALCLAAPPIFADHALALWWLFKYDATNPSGIGIHADPAAVNLNLWLTDDAACLEGGGLVIYSHVPDLEVPTQAVNREYASVQAEADLRTQLMAGGDVLRVPYRCNRCAIFVSDKYHESLAFRFAPGYSNRRCNLTLLFGDRWRPITSDGRDAGLADVGRQVAPGGTSSVSTNEDSAWGVFGQDGHNPSPNAVATAGGFGCSRGEDGWGVFD